MAVFVLQAFAVERGTASGRAEQEPACTLIASRPAQIADALEAEHRIEDEEWQQRLAVVGVAGCGGHPRRHRTGFGDAFFENLALDVFLVERELVGIFRFVLLTDDRIDAKRRSEEHTSELQSL